MSAVLRYLFWMFILLCSLFAGHVKVSLNEGFSFSLEKPWMSVGFAAIMFIIYVMIRPNEDADTKTEA